ncbi:hypothetical protein HY486_04500 [Candidatus Woesearchaeota archaeon]|nr:hypothetical protein [Candidatus Woesearchaeota archaeon]
MSDYKRFRVNLTTGIMWGVISYTFFTSMGLVSSLRRNSLQNVTILNQAIQIYKYQCENTAKDKTIRQLREEMLRKDQIIENFRDNQNNAGQESQNFVDDPCVINPLNLNPLRSIDDKI